MSECEFGSQQLVLNSVDRLGRAIDPETLAAAQAIAPRAVQHAVSSIGCPALATSLLAEAAATVSRDVRRRAQSGFPPIGNFQSYLFSAFVLSGNGIRQSEVPASKSVSGDYT